MNNSSIMSEGHGDERRGIIGGRLLIGEEFLECCERNGLCMLCGQTRVREKKKGMFGRSLTDIPIDTDERGEIIVYKGYHISPTCYSMAQAKEELGESSDVGPRDIMKRSRRRKSNRRNELRKSDRSKPDHQRSSLQETDSGLKLSSPEGVINASVEPIDRDDVTQNSAGSSSQELGASLSSGTEPRGGSPTPLTKVPDHPPSPGQHDFPAPSQRFGPRNSDTSDSSVPSTRRSAGHIKSASSDSDVGGAIRRPFSNSDSTFDSFDRNAMSMGDLSRQSPTSPQRHSNNFVPTMPSIRSTEETPVEIAIREVEEEVERRDVYQYLVQLGCHRSKPEVVKRGLELMRELVFQIHQSHPDKRYVFPNDNWCKTIKSAMSEHEEDGDIQEEGSMTITFVCSVSKKYKNDLIRNNNAKEVIVAMENRPSESEACCVALECLSRGSNVEWREEHAEAAFQGIKAVLSDSSNSGLCFAILALYNLTCHKSFRQEFVADHMRFIFAEIGVVGTFAAVIQGDCVSEGVIEASLSLLRDYWLRFLDISAGEEVASSRDAILGALMGAMCNSNSASFYGAICELLAAVPIPTSTEISWKQTLSDIICNCMGPHSRVESLQVAGLSALYNVFGNSAGQEDSVADLHQIVHAIFFAMNNFERSADIQARGCLAIAAICSGGDWYRDSVVQKGGITVVSNAFRSHVVDVDTATDPSNDVKDAASLALSSLAVTKAAIPVLQESNLLMDFQKVIKRDGLSHEQPYVQTCVISLISVALSESASESVDGGRQSSGEEPDYDFLAELVTQCLLQSLNEGDVQTLLTSLHALCSRSPNALDVILSVEDGQGTSRIAGLLQEYPDNASIQEAGCALLANIYFIVPFEGELQQTSQRSIGSKSTEVKTHSEREISAVSSALGTHKASARVVKNACEALCNFVCGLNVVASDPEDVRVPEEVAALFSGIPREADNAMAIHEENLETMKSVLRLLLVTVRLLEVDEMQRYSANLIARLFETMIRFPHDQEIHQTACSIIGKFVSLENDSIDASAASAEGLRAILLSLQMDDEAVVSCAVSIIASLLQRVFSLSNDLIEIEEYFNCLINCMRRFPGSVNVQLETCSIFTSLATLNDPFVKTMIANSDGVAVIMSALKTHGNQAHVMENAAKALGAIAEGIPDEILESKREEICDELLQSFDRCSNMEGVCCAALSALCEFCKKDEYFGFQIVQSNAVPSIVNVMALYIAAEDLQEGGCKLLWLLASKNDEHKSMLGAAGAVFALVSAMEAHIGSTAIQKEALTALKHVARVSSNKEALYRNEATDAVRLAIYANLDEPQVVAAALSALNDIAVDTSTREVMTVTDDTMNCVIQAMKIHPSDLEVQKIACWLLRSYSFNPQNLSLMRSMRADLDGLLIASSSQFPDDCGERAQSILQKL